MKKNVKMNVIETDDTITIMPCSDVTGSCTILNENKVDNGATMTITTNTPAKWTVNSEVDAKAIATVSDKTTPIPESLVYCSTSNEASTLASKKKSKFYIAVCDKTYYVGKKNQMKRLYKVDENFKKTEYNDTDYDERIIGHKFVSDPKLAMLMATIEDKKDTYKENVRKDFFNSLKFDKTHNVYVYDRYLTLRTRREAKQVHLERFDNGEYELILEHGEVQLLSTNVETIDLEAVKKEC